MAKKGVVGDCAHKNRPLGVCEVAVAFREYGLQFAVAYAGEKHGDAAALEAQASDVLSLLLGAYFFRAFGHNHNVGIAKALAQVAKAAKRQQTVFRDWTAPWGQDYIDIGLELSCFALPMPEMRTARFTSA